MDVEAFALAGTTDAMAALPPAAVALASTAAAAVPTAAATAGSGVGVAFGTEVAPVEPTTHAFLTLPLPPPALAAALAAVVVAAVAADDESALATLSIHALSAACVGDVDSAAAAGS